MSKNSIHISGSKIFCSLLAIFASLFYLSAVKAESPATSPISFEELVDSADYYSNIKNWVKAEEMTVKALRLKPAQKSNWLLWANLAEIRENLNDKEGALTAYTIGLSLQPESRKMRMGRASVLLEMGQTEDALDDLSTLINSDSTAEWPRMIRGMVLLDKGDLNNAEIDFKTLSQLNPENSQAYSGLAMIAAKRGDWKEAVSLYSKSLTLKEDVNIYFYKITLEADNGKLPEAAETLRVAMKKFPRNGNLFLLRAYLHKLNFQQEETEIALKLAKEYGADAQLIDSLFPKSSGIK